MDGFSFARDKRTGLVIHIRNVDRATRNGAKCDCVCLECQLPLLACQGEVNGWHFRHDLSTQCNGGNPMTAVHIEAVQIFCQLRGVLTKFGRISYRDPQGNITIKPSRFVSDVYAFLDDGSPLVLEVRVTHKCDPQKRDYLKRLKIHSIEVDLSNVNPTISTEELRRILEHEIERQVYLYWPRQEPEEIIVPPMPKGSAILNTSSSDPFVDFLWFIFMGWIVIKLVSSHKEVKPKSIRVSSFQNLVRRPPKRKYDDVYRSRVK